MVGWLTRLCVCALCVYVYVVTQAVRWGSEIESEDVAAVDFSTR